MFCMMGLDFDSVGKLYVCIHVNPGHHQTGHGGVKCRW